MGAHAQSLNRSPSEASLSKFGVRISLPKHPMSENPRSAAQRPQAKEKAIPSARMMRKFGRLSFAVMVRCCIASSVWEVFTVAR